MYSPSRSPTPTPPPRNPHHRLHLHPLPSRPNSLEGLVPPPLFISKRTRTPISSNAVYATVHDMPPSSSMSQSSSSPPSSPTWSRTSHSTPSSSVPTSPMGPPPSYTPVSPPSFASFLSAFPQSPPPSYWSTFEETPRHSLRRKRSPKRATLRELRVKESEAALARAYDESTEAYLRGTMFVRKRDRPFLGLERVWED